MKKSIIVTTALFRFGQRAGIVDEATEVQSHRNMWAIFGIYIRTKTHGKHRRALKGSAIKIE